MKIDMRRTALAAAAAALVAVGVMTAGCGEPAEADPTPVKTWKITPAPGGQRTPTPEATATEASGTPSAEGTVLEVVGLNTTFDVTELSAPAGPVTIKFDNQDPGIVHNIAVYPGDDANEDPIGATELEPGPLQQELQLTLEAGAYFYQCDSHPATMNGDLTVE